MKGKEHTSDNRNPQGNNSFSLDYLRRKSGLPGPRANLGLMYSFARKASMDDIYACLLVNSKEQKDPQDEFVLMCGIVGYCYQKRKEYPEVLAEIRPFASSQSWRIREAVAIGIQEMVDNNLQNIMDILEPWVNGTFYENRAVVAALCEPKLLKNEEDIRRVFRIVRKITMKFLLINGKLSGEQETLQKTLGYAWSVLVAASPVDGRPEFEKLAANTNPHIQWIVRENLRKNRLLEMDKLWVEKLQRKLAMKRT
jgi:hypothetical protein